MQVSALLHVAIWEVAVLDNILLTASAKTALTHEASNLSLR